MKRRFTLFLVVGFLSGGCASGSSSASTEQAVPVAVTTSIAEVTVDPAWAIQVFDGRRALIVTVDAEGGGRTSPTKAAVGGDQNNPDWAPDGSQISFGMSDGSRDDLWVANVDGTDTRILFDCEDTCDYIDDPAWSPDGASIAVCMFTADQLDHFGTLVSIDVASGMATTLYQPDRKEIFCAGPRWSPDGRYIVAELVERVGTALDADVMGVTLSIIDLGGDPAAVVSLTDSTLYAANADWSGNGDLIVYSALPEPGAEAPDLYTIKPDGSGLLRRTFLSNSGGYAAEPTFDLDGTIVFASDTGLSRLDLSTGEITSLFPQPFQGSHPRARPKR